MSLDNNIDTLVLGVSTGILRLESIDDFNSVNIAMVQQASRHIQLFTQEFDHALYDNDEFVDAIAEVARKSRFIKVEILVIDSTKAIKLGHRLVELAKRLPSSVAIRVVHTEYAHNKESFIVVDGKGLIRRPTSETYQGIAEFHSIPSAQQKSRYFVEVWERSSEDPSLRRLSL